MSDKLRFLICGTGLVILLLACSCGADRQARASSIPEEWPKVLRFNVSVGQENPEARTKRAKIVKQYLERQLRMPVDLTAATGYGGTIEAMRAKKIDATTLGPFAYLIASEKAGAEAIVTRGSVQDGTPGEYGGALAVPVDSPIRSVDDLVKHVKDLTISFVDPASASGYLVQRAFLDSIGIDPEHDFKKAVFSNNHIASVMTLKARKVDVAAMEDYLVPLLIGRGKLREGEIRTIWVSPRIPNSPIAVRKDLPAAFKKKLQDVFVEMPQINPEAYKGMFNGTSRGYSPDVTYVRIDDSAFDELRKLARDVKHVQLLEPGSGRE